MNDTKEDWPHDVILDLMGYLDGRGYPETVEVLADALVSFQRELRTNGLRNQVRQAPSFRVIAGGK